MSGVETCCSQCLEPEGNSYLHLGLVTVETDYCLCQYPENFETWWAWCQVLPDLLFACSPAEAGKSRMSLQQLVELKPVPTLPYPSWVPTLPPKLSSAAQRSAYQGGFKEQMFFDSTLTGI